MKMTKDYFNANVNVSVEIEYDDGHREWKTFKGYGEADAYIKRTCDGEYAFFSDEDLCCRQTDENVRKFLNLVFYNAKHNEKFKGKSPYKVLEIALKEEIEV